MYCTPTVIVYSSTMHHHVYVRLKFPVRHFVSGGPRPFYTPASYIFCVYLPSSDHTVDEFSEYLSDLQNAISTRQPSGQVIRTGDFSYHLQNMPTSDENLLKNNHNTHIQGSLQGAPLNGHTGSHVASPFLGSSCCHCFQNWLRWQCHTKKCSHHTACTCIIIVWLVTDNRKGGGIENAYWTLYWRHRIFATATLIHIHDKCHLASFLKGGIRHL